MQMRSERKWGSSLTNDGRGFESRIPGVVCRPLVIYPDSRGWLAEIFRQDELGQEHIPVMAYISMTQPGVGRGPHAHRRQTDLFCFPGPGEFRVSLWDQRPESPAYGLRQDFVLGENCPGLVIIPPGVVHGYRNLSGHRAWCAISPTVCTGAPAARSRWMRSGLRTTLIPPFACKGEPGARRNGRGQHHPIGAQTRFAPTELF